jgi:pimeloyl-ACP methyl ester carboxylesterase
MMYRTPRDVPFLIEKAAAGDFGPFAEAGLKANRGVYEGGGMGLYYCITCGEFVSRIKPDEVEPATRGSYLGSWRVRDQMAACKYWPKPELPADYFEPFRLETPIVLVSGSEDSAAPPKWGEKAKLFMPNAIHVVVPGGAHTPENSCTRSIRHQLFRTGTTKDLDLTCINKLQPPPFKLPSGR